MLLHLLWCPHSDGSATEEDNDRMTASAEDELTQLQALNLGDMNSRDGVLDEVRCWSSTRGCIAYKHA